MQGTPFFIVIGCHPEVVHILAHIVFMFVQEVREVSSHCALEEGWSIAQPKVHYLGNVGALARLDGCLVSILFLDADVTVSPSYVELREEVLAMQCFHGLSYTGNGVVVFLCDGIHPSVVHDDALLIAILLANVKDRRNNG